LTASAIFAQIQLALAAAASASHSAAPVHDYRRAEQMFRQVTRLDQAAVEPWENLTQRGSRAFRPSEVDGRVANAVARCRRPAGVERPVRADVML
jgi:hypothetical protein